MRGNQNTLLDISGYCYEPGYQSSKIFFFSVKTEMLLYRQILLVWVLRRCDFPGVSQYCSIAFFLYGQKS